MCPPEEEEQNGSTPPKKANRSVPVKTKPTKAPPKKAK